MLARILPETISKSWKMLKEVIRGNSMPLVKMDEKALSKIFEKLLGGDITCWYGHSEDKVHTVVLTEVLSEPGSETKNLMIFTVSIIEKVQPDEYISMLETLRKYAKGLSCTNVFCYSSNDKLNSLFETYGADTSYRLVKYEL